MSVQFLGYRLLDTRRNRTGLPVCVDLKMNMRHVALICISLFDHTVTRVVHVYFCLSCSETFGIVSDVQLLIKLQHNNCRGNKWRNTIFNSSISTCSILRVPVKSDIYHVV